MLVSIAEGFDMVGKSKLIEDLMKGAAYRGVYDKTYMYKPTYKVFDLKFNRNQSWITGFTVIDFLKQSGIMSQNHHLVIDRHIATSWVYDNLYGDSSQITDEVILADLNVLSEFDRCNMYYVMHKSKDSAQRIYDNDKDHNDKLDKFESFNHYWKLYKESDELFSQFFSKWDIDYVSLTSESSENGSRVVYI